MGIGKSLTRRYGGNCVGTRGSDQSYDVGCPLMMIITSKGISVCRCVFWSSWGVVMECNLSLTRDS